MVLVRLYIYSIYFLFTFFSISFPWRLRGWLKILISTPGNFLMIPRSIHHVLVLSPSSLCWPQALGLSDYSFIFQTMGSINILGATDLQRSRYYYFGTYCTLGTIISPISMFHSCLHASGALPLSCAFFKFYICLLWVVLLTFKHYQNPRSGT